ncbi:hypothetical protein JCM8097_002011 [Rhodosporidiobolus ruineniae]
MSSDTTTAADDGDRNRPLSNVRALLFDTFGTLVDWEGSVTRALEEEGTALQRTGTELSATDWLEFTRRWRAGYMKRTREIAAGGEGPGNIDDLHLEILNTLLDDPSYAHLSSAWSASKRKDLCQVWHRLDGSAAWPDVKPGLEELKKLDPPVLLTTLSNGTLRLLIDLARHSSLPLDAHFSGDLLGAYKPNPRMYLGACALLGFDEAARARGEVALCAAHIDDLRAAETHGLRTIYLRRPTEDTAVPHGGRAVKPKSEGGEVDIVLEGAEGEEGLRGLMRALGRV